MQGHRESPGEMQSHQESPGRDAESLKVTESPLGVDHTGAVGSAPGPPVPKVVEGVT